MLKNNGMKPVPTTINNPTANSINERMHQRMGNQLRSILHSRETSRNFEQAARIVEDALVATVFAIRATMHSTVKTTSTVLVFHRDMILNVPFITNLQSIQDRRQRIVNQNLRRQNARRFDYDYRVDDEEVLIRLANTIWLY
jgi:hypothetical protein